MSIENYTSLDMRPYGKTRTEKLHEERQVLSDVQAFFGYPYYYAKHDASVKGNNLPTGWLGKKHLKKIAQVSMPQYTNYGGDSIIPYDLYISQKHPVSFVYIRAVCYGSFTHLEVGSDTGIAYYTLLRGKKVVESLDGSFEHLSDYSFKAQKNLLPK